MRGWRRERASAFASKFAGPLRSRQDTPDEVPCSSWRNQVARVSWEVRIAISFLVVLSGALLLVAAWIGRRAELSARKYFPLQFTDELSSGYYMQYVLFNRSIPLEIR